MRSQGRSLEGRPHRRTRDSRESSPDRAARVRPIDRGNKAYEWFPAISLKPARLRPRLDTRSMRRATPGEVEAAEAMMAEQKTRASCQRKSATPKRTPKRTLSRLFGSGGLNGIAEIRTFFRTNT